MSHIRVWYDEDAGVLAITGYGIAPAGSLRAERAGGRLRLVPPAGKVVLDAPFTALADAQGEPFEDEDSAFAYLAAEAAKTPLFSTDLLAIYRLASN